MLNQILITIAVLAAVVAFTRLRRQPERQEQRAPAPQSRRPSMPALIGYAFVLVMIVGATLVFYLQWQDANQVMTIEVVDARSGTTTVYHVFRKDLGERTFRTIDGRYVSLGDADRMEVTEN